MFISHPLDTIKTNMQSENMRFMQATRILFKTEGVIYSEYKYSLMQKLKHVVNFRQSLIIVGFCFHCVQLDFWIQSFSACTAIHSESIKICMMIKQYLFILLECNHLLFLCFYRTKSNESKQKYWFAHVFLAGCTGGIVKAICACPIELSKVRLQVKVSKLSIGLQINQIIHVFRFWFVY